MRKTESELRAIVAAMSEAVIPCLPQDLEDGDLFGVLLGFVSRTIGLVWLEEDERQPLTADWEKRFQIELAELCRKYAGVQWGLRENRN